MLTLGALVHKIRHRPSLQQDTKAKAACDEYIKVTQHFKIAVTLLLRFNNWIETVALLRLRNVTATII